MKSALVFSLMVASTLATCNVGQYNDPRGPAKASDGINDLPNCMNALRRQIKMEFEASLQYMMMGVHFAQDTINLPGFAKMFFDHANEERQHGVKFIEYLKLRGDGELEDLGIDQLGPILAKDT